MATQFLCLFNKYVYCKHGEKCRKRHVNEICEKTSCDSSKCSESEEILQEITKINIKIKEFDEKLENVESKLDLFKSFESEDHLQLFEKSF